MSLVKRKPTTFETRAAVTVIGICTGIIGFRYFDGWVNYVPLAILLIIGYFSITQKNALINGVLFGATCSATALIIMGGYSYYLHIIAFGLLFAISGSLFGLAIAYIGYSVKVLTRKKI